MNTRLNRGSLRSMPGGVDSDLDSGFGSSTFGRGIMHGFMGAEGPRNDGNVGEGSRGRDHRDLVGASSADMFFELQKSDDGVLRGTNVFNVDAYVDSGNTNSKDDVRNSPSDFSTSDVRPYGEDDIYSDRVESAHSDGRGEIGEHSGGSVRAGSNDGDGGGVGRVISNANSKVGRENLSATRGPNRPKGAGTRAGRIRVKWGLDVDVEVPLLLESLVKGPWDPRGEVWALQVDMACEVGKAFCVFFFFFRSLHPCLIVRSSRMDAVFPYLMRETEEVRRMRHQGKALYDAKIALPHICVLFCHTYFFGDRSYRDEEVRERVEPLTSSVGPCISQGMTALPQCSQSPP